MSYSNHKTKWTILLVAAALVIFSIVFRDNVNEEKMEVKGNPNAPKVHPEYAKITKYMDKAKQSQKGKSK